MYKLMYISCLLTVMHSHVTYCKCLQRVGHWCLYEEVNFPPPAPLSFMKILISLYFCKCLWLSLYQGLYQSTGIRPMGFVVKRGENYSARFAIPKALRPILSSPNFLYQYFSISLLVFQVLEVAYSDRDAA